jgi:hypothetical protein
MDDTLHFKDEKSDGWRDRQTPPDLMDIVRGLKADNERLIRG